MEASRFSARELYSAVKANPTRKRFGVGLCPALVNIDLQKASTCVGEFPTAYETDPHQLAHVNDLATEFRARGFPVVWTYVAYMASGDDCGVWGTRTNTLHGVDTVVVTGGSTSGCVRATVVDSLSRSYRTIVPEECVADKHEGPHFASLYDMALKYADVISVNETLAQLRQVTARTVAPR